MPVPAIASEAFFLKLIWQTSCVFVVLSLVVLAILIIARYFSQNKTAQSLAIYKKLTPYFYAAISSPVDPVKESLPVLSPREKHVAIQVALDLLRSLKGSNSDKMVALLHAWDIQPYLHKLAESGNRGEKIKALTLFALFRDEHSLQTLYTYAGSTDAYIQLAALRGLSGRDDATQVDGIITNLENSQWTNSLVLADVLSRFGNDAVPALLKLIKGNASNEAKVAALMALSNTNASFSPENIIALLGDDSPEIRAQAVATLGKIDDAETGSHVIAKLDDPVTKVRIEAAKALGTMNLDVALAPLLDRLSDTDWWVRFWSADALYRMGDRGIALLKAASLGDGDQSVIASQFLAEKGLA